MIAWYEFHEEILGNEIDYLRKETTDLVGSRKDTLDFKEFQPIKPLRVDEFADGNPPYSRGMALALASWKFDKPHKNVATLGLTIFLESPQRFGDGLTLFSFNPPVKPAAFERGFVTLRLVEEFDAVKVQANADRPLDIPWNQVKRP